MVRASVRRIGVSLSSLFTRQELFAHCLARLREEPASYSWTHRIGRQPNAGTVRAQSCGGRPAGLECPGADPDARTKQRQGRDFREGRRPLRRQAQISARSRRWWAAIPNFSKWNFTGVAGQLTPVNFRLAEQA